MKANSNYILREIAGESVVVPTGEAATKLNGMISLNDVAGFIWKMLQEDTTPAAIEAAILEEYEVTEEEAHQDVEGFLDAMRQFEMLEE